MANEKILVVDDDTNICELLRLYLTKEGYQVTTANDGEEGLEKFNQLKPDMVLLDVMMPRMDGLEVCRRIRKLGNTPVMMLTARAGTRRCFPLFSLLVLWRYGMLPAHKAERQTARARQQTWLRKRPECRNSSVHPYLYSKRFPAEKNRKEDTRH